MKSLTYLLAILFTSFSFNAHAQQYTFEYNFKKGNSITQTSIMDMKVNADMGSKITTKNSFIIKDVQNDLITIDLTYDSMDMEMDVMGQKMNISSETANPMFPDLGEILKSLKENPITLTITKSGVLKDIKGLDKLQEVIEKSSTGNPMNAMILGQLLGEETLKSTFEQMSAHFPTKPVGIGESWEKAFSINQSVIKVDATMKITLLSVKDNIATLKVETQLGKKDKIYTQEINGMTVNTSMEGTQNGTMDVDLRTGWTKESNFNQSIQSESTVMDRKISQTITSTIKATSDIVQ
jgi:hypothetical protein